MPKVPVPKRELSKETSPSYYSSLSPEPIDVIEGWDLGFSLGNCVKYISRAGKKTPDPVRDLEKAAWYLLREIERLKEQ